VHSKEERFAEFLRRLALLPRARNISEAREQLERTLNQVEDEMTGIAYDPTQWQSDGRMYPPQDDSLRLTRNPAVLCFRSKGHRTYIAQGGAIEIHEVFGKVVFSKSGSDGKTIADLLRLETGGKS
jgi:hypothetical protein